MIFGNGELSHANLPQNNSNNHHQHSPSSSSSGHHQPHALHHLHLHGGGQSTGGSSQHSGAITPLPSHASSTHNGNGSSAFTYHFDHTGSGTVPNNNGLPSMTSSATSNTNSVGSAGFDPFETGHSRSNSSQTSSSRISCTTGFNSLPSHSRQGSADSENTGNTR